MEGQLIEGLDNFWLYAMILNVVIACFSIYMMSYYSKKNYKLERSNMDLFSENFFLKELNEVYRKEINQLKGS